MKSREINKNKKKNVLNTRDVSIMLIAIKYKTTYRISSYSFRGNYSLFEFGNPKVTVHKAKGHST